MKYIDPLLVECMPKFTRFFYWLILRFPGIGYHMMTAAFIISDQALDIQEKRIGEAVYKEYPIQVVDKPFSNEKNIQAKNIN